MSHTPTIVLVHGALADASIWNGVSNRLMDAGQRVIAPAIPLRGLAADVNYLSAFLGTIDGPAVLVGHSYAGSIISHPAIHREKVRALVFVAAFIPDRGESTGALNGRWPGSKLNETSTLVRPYGGGMDLYLLPEQFADVYAADLPPRTVALMAAAQRPIDPAALGETFDGVPTWQRVPSWSQVSTQDNSLPTEAQRFMSQRAGATVVELAASHASPVSQPGPIAELIAAAVRGRADQASR